MSKPKYVREKRHHERFELEVEITVRTGSALLPGRTLDISEYGVAAILPLELQEGENVELQIRLPSATLITRAIVRDRNVFRHGFEFVEPLKESVLNGATAQHTRGGDRGGT